MSQIAMLSGFRGLGTLLPAIMTWTDDELRKAYLQAVADGRSTELLLVEFKRRNLTPSAPPEVSAFGKTAVRLIMAGCVLAVVVMAMRGAREGGPKLLEA